MTTAADRGMSTETMTDTSLEQWVMELPADEAGCGNTRRPCDRPAAWHTQMTPCGHGTQLCTPCLEIEKARRLLGVTSCRYCDRPALTWTYRPI